MRYHKFRGIVVRSIDYLESDKLITLLTYERGSVLVKAKGVRKKGAKLAHCARQFFCGDFECVESRGRLILTGGSRIYDFTGIAEDLDKYYHACHFADIASSVIMEDHPDEDMLRLFLNTLHFLLKGDISLGFLKALFELRSASISGFAPITDECAACGKALGNPAFSIEHGGLVCCAGGMPVDGHVAGILSAVSESTLKELFLLKIPEKSLPLLENISGKYIETVFDRRFDTLEAIKGI